MTSATGLASTASIASGNAPGPNAPQSNGSARSTMKSTSTAKSSDPVRKQSSSPGDGSQRRTNPSSQKAWSSGTNPVTQKSSQTQPNGNISQTKAGSAAEASPAKESSTPDRHANDRLIFVLGSAIGTSVGLMTRSGDRFEGVLSSSVLDSAETSITLKMTRLVQSASNREMNGVAERESPLVGSGQDFAMTFNVREIADLSITELSVPEAVKTRNGATPGFRTDTDISAGVSRGERTLQPWIPDTSTDVDLSLDSGRVEWDQFETNNRLFGANSTYDENIYTTRIDRSAPSYRRREAEAARLAKEIEGTASTNAHIREERGQAQENDGDDEEAKYSGVRRDDLNFPPLSSGAPNKYTPPARRAPTGQPTVAGAPVDPAIISAQISRPEGSTSSESKSRVKKVENGEKASPATKEDDKDQAAEEVRQEPVAENLAAVAAESSKAMGAFDPSGKPGSVEATVQSQQRAPSENPTDNVENKVLNAFRQFGDSEKQKLQESRRVQAKQDRTAKLNDLLRFSKTFKLRTPVPTDLVGILAKDPVKQEQIIEKAQKEHEEQVSTTASPVSLASSSTEAKTPLRSTGSGKVEVPTITAPLSDRQTTGRGRAAYPSFPARNDRPLQPQAVYAGRGASGMFMHRSGAPQQDRKSNGPPTIPTPIPILDSRSPPQGPAADQSGLTSPQRSTVQTPTSAVSTKFNVKALEFKPNAAAPAFNPAGASNPPSSPRSMARTRSASRASSPSNFFGVRKPKPSTERPLLVDSFNPIKRMKKEAQEQNEPHKKDYSSNGGIPNAYQTGPVWDVREENKEKTYTEAFDRLFVPNASPAQSVRSASSHHIQYHPQMPAQMQNGHHNTSQVPVAHAAPPQMHVQHHPSHLEENHHRMHMPTGSPQVYPSPRMPSGQMVYASPMGHPAQLAYGQPVPQFFPAQGGPAPMQMRQYSSGPQFVPSQGGQLPAPIVIQQQSTGSYLAMPQQYPQQMQMYSPSPAHVYPQHIAQPQHSGYPSPGRGAPMMMHQGSQQGHLSGQPVMYAIPNQPGQMGYPQPGAHMVPMRAPYPGQQVSFSSSPHQAHHFPSQPPRVPSTGYGQMHPKMMPQQMQQLPQMPPNGPHQPGTYNSVDLSEEAK